VPVRYGPEKPQYLGYTTDLGRKGLFLQGNQLFPPGAVLELEVMREDGTPSIRGVVRWVKEVPPAFRRSLRGGMGIELIAGGGSGKERD
jgi:PilZ domain